MNANRFEHSFRTIYGTDLVFAPECWKLCGDAHCCNFSRYKLRMGVTHGQPFQELPLLPGEMDFLKSSGFIRDFGEVEHRVVEFQLARGVLRAEFLVSRGKACACQHDTRTTVCRLYPLMPRYDDDCRLIGVDTMFGMFEHIERLDVLPRACQVANIPFGEMDKFLTICAALAANPTQVFYVRAFELAKAHAVQTLKQARERVPAGRSVSTFQIFQGLYAINQLLDPAVMRHDLDALADRFAERHGDAFSIG